MPADEDENEKKEKDKYIMYNLPSNTDKDYMDGIYDYNMGESIKALLNDDISENLYNFNDIEKILFKFDKSFDELGLNLMKLVIC